MENGIKKECKKIEKEWKREKKNEEEGEKEWKNKIGNGNCHIHS